MYRLLLPVLLPLASAAVHTVQVGPKGLVFVPQTISAVKGDTVVFELNPGHNVVQGKADGPCSTADNYFYSGEYQGTDSGAKKFVVNVTSNDPVYYYCGAPQHCQNGMVGGINIPTSGNETIDAYSKAAANVQTSDLPSQLRGGELMDDAQIASLNGTAASSAASGSASASASGSSGSSAAASASATSTHAASGSASHSASATKASSTGGASSVSSGQFSGIAAIVLGVAAWVV